MSAKSKHPHDLGRQAASSRDLPAAPAFSRAYRKPTSHPDEISFQVVVDQTDLWITTRKNISVDPAALALQRVNELRAQLIAWMLLSPDFGPSLYPLPVPEHAPSIIHRMGIAASQMGVGPMAVVAGALAAMVAETLVKYSPEVIVENGGDIMLYSTRERVVGLLPDPKQHTLLGVRIGQNEFPVSLCSSSSTIGHSLSFGNGELVVVRAPDACLADAAATAFCNMLQEADDVRKVADRAADLAHLGIEGIFAQCRGKIAVWGNMELVAVDRT